MQFKGRFTDGTKGFSRDRKLTFKALVILISQGMLKSVQRELNQFYQKISDETYEIHAVTKGAFTQARAKLIPEAFLELTHACLPEFYESAPYYAWKEHRLIAIDGSTLNLPNHKTVEEEFGVHHVGCNADVKRSMARISLCYDVANLITLDARIDKFTTSEHNLLRTHLDTVKFLPKDILLLDRGYPSIALMYELQHRNIHFCMRMKDSWWKEVQKMIESGGTDKEVMFRLPSKDIELQKKLGSRKINVRCRMVVIELENGVKEVLCTSLLDKNMYSLSDLRELYHYRWGVEEAYKLLKERVEIEVFSGKTAKAVKQDFYAKVFMMTMCAIMSFPIEQKVREESKSAKTKHPKQINRTNALGFIKSSWPVLWMKRKLGKMLVNFDLVLEKTADLVRPGRSFPRKHSQKKPPPMNYKQL